MGTRTGGFPIGFRRMGVDWQRDLRALAGWARESGFDAIDLGRVTAEDVATLREFGLRLGSGDLQHAGGLLSSDAGERRAAIEGAVGYVQEAAALGTRAFFVCIRPDPSMDRATAYALAVESYAPVAAAAHAAGGSIAIEGWPGGSPNLTSLCCTPETVRSFIKDLGGKGVGINYDPSHLIRLGVDHIRFLQEFVPYVWHVHGKDTEILTEAIYELGLYQPAAFSKPRRFGEYTWRYTIPGHGCGRWTEIFRILEVNGYQGMVSVELEDESFRGSEDGDKAGFLHSLHFLQGA